MKKKKKKRQIPKGVINIQDSWGTSGKLRLFEDLLGKQLFFLNQIFSGNLYIP